MAKKSKNPEVQIIEEFIEDSSEGDETYETSEDSDRNDEEVNVVPNESSETGTVEIVVSPGGTKYWIPTITDNVKLSIGDRFGSVEEAEMAYRRYADEVGFDVRKANKKKNKEGGIQNRYLFCSKEGIPEKQSFNSLKVGKYEHKVRNSNVKRTGCKACIKFSFRKEDSSYIVYKFEERHNHSLYNAYEKRFSRSRRQLQYTDYRNIYNGTGSSLGASKSHSIQVALKGGVANVGPSVVEFKNATRDMIAYVGNKDAHMIIKLLTKRKERVPEFYFDYMCTNGELQALFWADEVSRMNYKEFGDSISFDATYRTNRHAMNFVPFIAIDNHKRSVVVGSALISGETTENYTWILQAFLKAHTKQPQFVITDQCPSMKEAIPEVLTESKHRFCVWHIMKKVPKKVNTLDSKTYATFRKTMNKLVWSTHITVDEFEYEWEKMITDFGLEGNDWLTDMYELREYWISAYYKNDPMSGLMRTTSRSESAHAYFRLFASFKNDFVRFLRAFDGAIDKQRNTHACLEFANRNTFPRCVTPLSIERNASEAYTRLVFFDVQKEIQKAVFFCGLQLKQQDDVVKQYVISHQNKKLVTKASYEVMHDVKANTLTCECNLFLRIGILCRHIFKVLLNDGVDKIPDAYIERRWTRALVPVQIQAAKARYGEIDVEKENLINRLYSDIDLIVSRVRNDDPTLREVVQSVSEMKDKYGASKYSNSSGQDKAEALKECYGVEAPENPEVNPAAGIKNKGSGTGKRLMGALEKAVEKNKRAKRKCRVCGEKAHHDSHNCPTRSSS